MSKGKFRNYNFSDRRTDVSDKEIVPDTQVETPVEDSAETVTESSPVEASITSEAAPEAPVETVIESAPVEAPVEASVTPVVTPPPVVKHESHIATLLKGLKMKLAGIIEHTGIGKLEEPVTGASRRFLVYQHVKEILNITDPNEFKKQMNTFHNLIKEGYDDVFNERNLFKFPNEWPGSSNEFQEYRKILQLLIETRTPEGLKHFGKKLDIDKFGLKLNQKERQNLVSYLNL